VADHENLHPYDGRDRRFAHDDADPEQRARGRALVATLLSLAAPPAEVGLRYALSFFSGGIGVLDRMHVAMPCAAELAEAIATGAGMWTLEQLLADDELRPEIEWLVYDEEHPERSPQEQLVAFIEDERVPFQPPPHAGMRAWLLPHSGVNAWSLVYAVDGELAFIGFDQG
jgi:DNA-binding transcriptional LysR family regulator